MEKFRTRTEKKQQKKKLYLLLGTVMIILVFALTVILGLGNNSGTKESKEKTEGVTVTVTESLPKASADETDTQTEAPPLLEAVPSETEIPTENTAHSEKLTDILTRAGYSIEELSGTQLIVVEAKGSSAEVNTFEKVDGVWKECDVLSDENGFVGYMGVSADASEYVSYTPEGLFYLGTGFGIKDDPGTGLDYFKVTEDSYWVDDVNSEYYNMHVEGKEDKGFDSAEHLIDYAGSYDYCVFIEYNTNPVVPGKGSAFFLHVGDGPTEGCVAISEEGMKDTLRWLQKEQLPQIIIF